MGCWQRGAQDDALGEVNEHIGEEIDGGDGGRLWGGRGQRRLGDARMKMMGARL